jgi:hypothetical protein
MDNVIPAPDQVENGLRREYRRDYYYPVGMLIQERNNSLSVSSDTAAELVGKSRSDSRCRVCDSVIQ